MQKFESVKTADEMFKDLGWIKYKDDKDAVGYYKQATIYGRKNETMLTIDAEGGVDLFTVYGEMCSLYRKDINAISQKLEEMGW